VNIKLRVKISGSEELELRVPVESEHYGLYTVTLPDGTDHCFSIGQPSFVLLHDIGVRSLLDGYYREAVMTFASSLERFYEYFVHVASLKLGIDEGPLQQTWKKVAKQSERQLGAFLFVHLLLKRQICDLPIPKLAELRNAVVHNGHFPTEAETFSYSFQVSWCLSRLYRDALNTFRGELVQYQLMVQPPSKIKGSPISIRGLPVGRPLLALVSLDDFDEDQFRSTMSSFSEQLHSVYIP
jgi:hypothetical protein